MTKVNTTAAYYTDAYLEYGSAYFLALNADSQWQRELDFQNIDRYSSAARGVAGSGSMLRLLYEAKVRAGENLRTATEALRANGTSAEIEAISEISHLQQGRAHL